MNVFKTLPFRLEEKMYKDLRNISHISEKPMAEIIREGLEKILKDYKKLLTHKGIAV